MKIGFIGLGVMGRLMGQRLMQNGYQLVVRDANPAAEASFAALGAEVAGSAREVADRAEIVLCSLPTPAVVREVFIGAEGLVHGQAMRIAVDLSTTGMQVAREIATAFAPAGKTLVDAPVSGGVLGAEAGTLSVMTSGGGEASAEVEPLLRIIGKNVFYLGADAGLGQTMKLVNNMLAATTLVASCEALVYGRKMGLDAEQMLEIINASSGRSFATQEKIPQCILRRNFPHRFPTDLILKDVQLGLDEADRAGAPMWVIPMVRQFLAFARSQGDGPRDYGHVIKHFEAWAGVEFGSEIAQEGTA